MFLLIGLIWILFRERIAIISTSTRMSWAGTPLKKYLSRVVFYQKRPFTRGQIWKLICVQSKPFAQMTELVRELNARCKLKIVLECALDSKVQAE